MCRYRINFIGFVILITLLIPAYASSARLALVIGNAKYTDSPLYNPVNDANDMADSLKKLGFEVILKTDIDRRTMVAAIQQFGQRLTNGSVGLFYFSGHGLQSRNINFLLPLRANIKSEADVEFETVSANRILRHMEQANDQGVNILILDACRDNPYKSYMKGASMGLARMDSPMGSLIAYATAPGKVAYGEGRERNSIYTKHLLKALSEMAHLSITDLFIAVRNQVVKATDRQQVPWESVSLTQRFCFGECGKAEQDVEIAQLLRACERHFQANRLTTGRGGTALECYEKVLERDPANAEALAGLERIEAKYAEWTQQALDKGDTAKVQQYIASLRLVNPESSHLADLETQLQPITPQPEPTLTPIPTPVEQRTRPPKYSLRSEPLTVSDSEAEKVFGLKIDNDSSPVWRWRPLTYIENDFEDQGDVVVDHATGLMWQKSGSKNLMLYEKAQEYVRKLNQQNFAGYDDRRLPTVEELISLLEPKEQSNGLYINLVFDEHQGLCWSGDRRSAGLAWLIHFGVGRVFWKFVEDKYYVRCVRSRQ